MVDLMYTDRRLTTLLFLLFSLAHNVWTLGIQFTTPAGGGTFPAGQLSITWEDAGGSPNMAALTSYSLDLIVGGNNPNNYEAIESINNGTVAAGSFEATIPASIAQSIQNGFYLRMTSNTTDGNEVINYSNRFTLINMKGTTDNQVLQAANAAASSVTNVPSAQYNVLVDESPSTVSATKTSDNANAKATRTAESAAGPNNDQNVSGMPGMTKGLIIMGGLLAVIGAISIVLWIMFCCRRMRKSSHRKEHGDAKLKEAHEESFDLGNKTELAAYRSSRAIPNPPVEMNGERDRQELAAQNKTLEAPASPMVYELEGDMSAWEAGSGRRSKAWEAV